VESLLTRAQRSAIIQKIDAKRNCNGEVEERTIGLRVSILASGSSGKPHITRDGAHPTPRGRRARPSAKRSRGSPPSKKIVEHLDGILITHEHTDHCNGLPQMLWFMEGASMLPNRLWT